MIKKRRESLYPAGKALKDGDMAFDAQNERSLLRATQQSNEVS